MNVRVQKTQARFKRIRVPKGPDIGAGEFFLLVDITAPKETVYIPLSIASGKKPTGFVYQIEGTAEGTIVTTDISCKGAGVTQVTLGTIVYSKIPAGKTATFRILVEMRGRVGKAYGIIISRIHYKQSPSDARYQKFPADIHSSTLKFN
ncbi:MAG: hypothetical protein WBK28_00865 [Minisyncoccia bacterium]